jgi:hypothetical protein
MNIIFSTTRQWNPGDEFILRGVRNILLELGVTYNPIIFNRNPDVRSCFQDRQVFKTSKVPNDFTSTDALIDLEANLKFGFFDNSLKPDTDCGFANLVILAGTPEWCNGKMLDLYASVIRHNLPVMILGVGGGCDIYSNWYREVIGKAKAFSVRDEATHDAVSAQGFEAHLLPCPALLGVSLDRERTVQAVRKVGLIYQASRDDSVIWNGFSPESYREMLATFRRVLDTHVCAGGFEFELICHYVDEIPLAIRDFPGVAVRYSFDSAEYVDIYAAYDLVIGSRVHGIGIAASMGIPGIALVHDSRGSACAGFLAELVPISGGAESVANILPTVAANVAPASARLRAHKLETMARYKEIVTVALGQPSVTYDSALLPAPTRRYDLRDLAPFHLLIAALRSEHKIGEFTADAPEHITALLQEMRVRLINIELKVNDLLAREIRLS